MRMRIYLYAIQYVATRLGMSDRRVLKVSKLDNIGPERGMRAPRGRRHMTGMLSDNPMLDYRWLYACALILVLATVWLALSGALPGWAPFDAFTLSPRGATAVEIGMLLVLGFMTLLLIHARQVMLAHETVVGKNMDAILLTRTDGSILTANPATRVMLGYRQSELQAGGRDLLVDPEDPEAKALWQERELHGRMRGEVWMRHKDGRRVRVEVSSVVFDFKGEQRTAMIVRDVSQSRFSEYEQRIARTAIDETSQGVCVFDHVWNIIWANHATERISGYPRDQLIGNPAPIRRHLEAEDPDKLAEMRDALARHGRWQGEVYTRRRNGEIYPLFATLTRIESLIPDQPHYVASFSDVSAIRNYERRLRDVLQYDPITALPNRVLLEEKVQQALGRADPDRDTLALMLIDINDFRSINESFGHQVGDRMLKAAAQRLIEHMDECAFIARHTGDSFAVLLDGLADIEEAGLIANTIVSAFEPGFEEGPDGLIQMMVGIGIACFPENGSSVSTLMRHAEIALGAAKQSGGDGYRLYQSKSEHKAQNFITLAAEMRGALERGEFEAYFQPILDTDTQRIVSMEALARWPGARSPIGPAEFIPVAERSGLIAALSEHMLRQACRHLRTLACSGHHGLSIAVNLSARQFRDGQLARRVLDILDQEHTATSNIMLEITESLLMEEPEAKRRILEQLQEAGLRVVMDDFGTGYSSLSYLKHFDLDGFKMDRSFTQNLPHNAKDAAIVRMILAIGHELELPIVAEGIETAEQARFLVKHGCHRLQGNHIGLPMPSADFLAYLDGLHQTSPVN